MKPQGAPPLREIIQILERFEERSRPRRGGSLRRRVRLAQVTFACGHWRVVPWNRRPRGRRSGCTRCQQLASRGCPMGFTECSRCHEGRTNGHGPSAAQLRRMYPRGFPEEIPQALRRSADEEGEPGSGAGGR